VDDGKFGGAADLFEREVHPRILFGPDDVPAIRERAARGYPALAAAEILRRAKVAPEPTNLAFAWLLTGEERWATAAVERMRSFVATHPGPAERETVGRVVGPLPLAFDVLYGFMADVDREIIETHMREAGLAAYRANCLSHPLKYMYGLGTNLFLYHFEPYVLALAATYDPARDRPAADQCADLLRRSLHLAVDEGGAVGEGTRYGWTDLCTLTLGAEFLFRAGMADLWAEEPRLSAMARQFAYLALPGGRGITTIGDAYRWHDPVMRWPALFYARRWGDPAMQWLWEQTGGRKTLEHPEIALAYSFEFALLWEDDAAAARAPHEAGWPRSKASGRYGVNVMRTGWGDDDVFFTLLAAGRDPGCIIHQQVDAGHFSLCALGEVFSTNSGYGDMHGNHHSVMLPEGKEPPGLAPVETRTQEPIQASYHQVWKGGRTEAFASGECADYCCVNIAEQWDCRWYYRHALLVAGPGVYPYVVLLDHADYCCDYGSWTWLMNSERGNRIEVDNGASRATVHGRTNRLDVAWSFPGPGDYARPHELEVSADTILAQSLENWVHYNEGRAPGFPRSMIPDGPMWHRRPRLVARLQGYNGQLLSVLVPRRAGEAGVQTRRIAAPGRFGLVVNHGCLVDTIVAAPHDRNVGLDGVEGEAKLAVARRNSEGRIVWWCAADVFRLRIDGRDLVPGQGKPDALREGHAGREV
jgi:hypothetical protein